MVPSPGSTSPLAATCPNGECLGPKLFSARYQWIGRTRAVSFYGCLKIFFDMHQWVGTCGGFFFFFLSQQFKRVLVLFAESYPASISALPLGMIEIANHNAMGMFSEAPSDLYRNISNSFSKRSHTSVTNVQTEKLIELSGDSAFLCGVH